MLAGALIDYRIRVHRIPIRWRTEIVEWNAPHRFVDVQVRGPYTLWHHTHTFEERGGGTLYLDDVRYRPRCWALTNWLFVRRDVKKISPFGASGWPKCSAMVRGRRSPIARRIQSTECFPSEAQSGRITADFFGNGYSGSPQ